MPSAELKLPDAITCHIYDATSSTICSAAAFLWLICNQTMRRAIVFLMAWNIKKILLVKQFGAHSVGVGSWGYLLVFFNCVLCY